MPKAKTISWKMFATNIESFAKAAREENRTCFAAEARQKKFKVDWSVFEPDVPRQFGRSVLRHIPVSEIVPFIDWKFFFTLGICRPNLLR
jgi:cobalamin-dependent methionine synthase I